MVDRCVERQSWRKRRKMLNPSGLGKIKVSTGYVKNREEEKRKKEIE